MGARSPATCAAETKSFSRSESVWERSTRAPQAQPVTVSTTHDGPESRLQERGQHDQQRQVGMIRKTFMNTESTSSTRPRK